MKSSAQPLMVSCGFTNGTSSEEGVTRVTGLLLYTGDESLESLCLLALRSCLLVAVGTMAGSLYAPSIQGRNCRHMSIRICFRIHFSTVTILQPTTLYPASPHSNVHSTRPVCTPASARSHRISAENALLNLSTINLKGFVCLSHVTTVMLQQKNDGSPILVVVATTPPQKR